MTTKTNLAVIRQLVLGLAVAVVLAFGGSTVRADSCGASVNCGGSSQVECGCMGDGVCTQTSSTQVRCQCTHFPTVECNCDGGCEDVIVT